MVYQIALMEFNGDCVIKPENFENTDDALDYGGAAPFVLVVDQSGLVVKARGQVSGLEGHTIEDVSARFAGRSLTEEESQLVIGATPLQALPACGDPSQEIERLRNEVKDLRAACQYYLERERAVIKLLSRE